MTRCVLMGGMNAWSAISASRDAIDVRFYINHRYIVRIAKEPDKVHIMQTNGLCLECYCETRQLTDEVMEWITNEKSAGTKYFVVKNIKTKKVDWQTFNTGEDWGNG